MLHRSAKDFLKELTQKRSKIFISVKFFHFKQASLLMSRLTSLKKLLSTYKAKYTNTISKAVVNYSLYFSNKLFNTFSKSSGFWVSQEETLCWLEWEEAENNLFRNWVLLLLTAKFHSFSLEKTTISILLKQIFKKYPLQQVLTKLHYASSLLIHRFSMSSFFKALTIS